MALSKKLQDEIRERLVAIEELVTYPERFHRDAPFQRAHSSVQKHSPHKCGKPLDDEQRLSASLLFIEQLREYELAIVRGLLAEQRAKKQEA